MVRLHCCVSSSASTGSHLLWMEKIAGERNQYVSALFLLELLHRRLPRVRTQVSNQRFVDELNNRSRKYNEAPIKLVNWLVRWVSLLLLCVICLFLRSCDEPLGSFGFTCHPLPVHVYVCGFSVVVCLFFALFFRSSLSLLSFLFPFPQSHLSNQRHSEICPLLSRWPQVLGCGRVVVGCRRCCDGRVLL